MTAGKPQNRPNALTELYQHVTALANRIIALEQKVAETDKERPAK